MCKSQREGGQRCAGHCRERVAKARDRHFAEPYPGVHLARWITAEIEYASTPEGQAEAVRKAEAGELFLPDDDMSDRWAFIAEQGDLLRERNSAMAALCTTEAIAEGDAFHAAAVAQMPDGVLPGLVRGPKSLERFLDARVESTFVHAQAMRETTSEVAAARSMMRWVEATEPDPKAKFNWGVPRTEEEKRAWLYDLYDREKDAKERQDAAAKGYASATSDLAAFGREHPTVGTGEPQSSMEAGFVGRIRNPDGSLSEDVYLVCKQEPRQGSSSPKSRADGMAEVFPIRAGDPNLQTLIRSPAGEGVPVRRTERTRVAHTSLVRAEPEMWDQYAGTAAYGGPRNSGHVLLRTAGDALKHDYEDSRFYSAKRRDVPFADPLDTNFVQDFINKRQKRAGAARSGAGQHRAQTR